MEKYKFIKKVGSGTFGTVYEGMNQENGKTVAIKAVKVEDTYHPPCQLKEVKALNKLRDHPNIITLMESLKAFENDDIVYLIFDYMHSDLHNFIQEKSQKGMSLTETQIKNMCFQILKGLEHMHAGGYFHRDLKPQNLLVSQSGDELKIADFGSVCEINKKTPCSKHVGTRGYKAPEVILDLKNYGPAVDMWALGVILGELFMGRLIFPAGKSTDDQIYKICCVLGTPSYFNRLSLPHYMKQCRFPQTMISTPYEHIVSLIPSEDAVSLFKSLCEWDPSKRLTATEALQHQFFFSCYPIPDVIHMVLRHVFSDEEEDEENEITRSCSMPPLLDFHPFPPYLPPISSINSFHNPNIYHVYQTSALRPTYRH